MMGFALLYPSYGSLLSVVRIYGLHPICKDKFEFNRRVKIARIYSAW